jgi:hypothetical protein
MAGENTQTSMEMYKEIYGDKLNDVRPNSSIYYDRFKFDEGDKLGDSYRQSVSLTHEHGATYNGAGGGVVTLNDPIQATIKEGNSSGFEFIMRSRITYAAASRGASSKQAFAQTWGTVLLNLRKSSMKRMELTLARGQMGLGQVSGTPAANVITISEASWSPTTFAGMEGAILEGWSTQAATATQRTGGSINLTITAVSFANRTITVTNDGDLADGDFLYLKGARTSTGFNEGPGLVKIAANSGSLFGIDAASWALWGGNTSPGFLTPTMGKFLSAACLAVDKGLDEKCFLDIPTKCWEVLNADLAAQRMYDGSYSKEKAENGSQRICYYGQAGEMEVSAHVFLQRGEAVISPKGPYKRIGSADLGMGVPGLSGDGGRDIFFHVESNNTVEARTFADNSLFCEGPSTSVYISGITYPA